jgi:hypothetical protein
VYLVLQDARFAGADQVVLSRSTNAGRTWTAPKLVSKNPATQAFTPSVEVDRHGNVGVTYYDFTADTVASPTLDTYYWFTRSRDRGATLSARERVTARTFDMRSARSRAGSSWATMRAWTRPAEPSSRYLEWPTPATRPTPPTCWLPRSARRLVDRPLPGRPHASARPMHATHPDDYET